MRIAFVFVAVFLPISGALAQGSGATCPPQALSADDAKALLMFLEHTPLQGGEAPKFMALVSRLQQVAGLAVQPGAASGRVPPR